MSLKRRTLDVLSSTEVPEIDGSGLTRDQEVTSLPGGSPKVPTGRLVHVSNLFFHPSSLPTLRLDICLPSGSTSYPGLR